MFEVWDFKAERMLASWREESRALAHVRQLLSLGPVGRINDLGLVRHVAGEAMTYPLEGAALLVLAFGLKEDDG